MKGVNPSEITMLARIAFGGAMVYSAVSLWRTLRLRSEPDSYDARLLDELWERFERGEITWQEYEALSRDLQD